MSQAIFQFLIRMVMTAGFACWLATPAHAQAQQSQTAPNARVALVIGNSSYQHAPPIETATKDAGAIAASLTRLGFAVSSLSDADYDSTRKALLAFAQAARQASIATIYFAGYGVQAKGENYLVPIEAELQSDVEIGATSLHALMSAVAGAKELGLVILEAGRGNPFASEMSSSSRTRGIEPGLATVEPGEDNILVAFAARPGTTAVDSNAGDDAFTEALVKNIETPGLEIQYLFRNIEADVREATDQAQEAAHYGSLTEKEIFLKPAETMPNSMELASASEPALATTTSEQIAWDFLRETTDASSLRQFIERFPNGEHQVEATELITQLEQAAQAPVPAPPPSVEDIAWSILKERPTAGGLQRFLDAYRDSPHAKDALALLTKLAEHQQGKLEQQAYKPQLETQPVLPTTRKTRPIVQRISRNNSNVAEAWQIVRTSRDPLVLRKFAAEFPSRQYVSSANARLTDLGLDYHRPSNLAPAEVAELSLAQCDRLAGGELARVSRDAVDACRRALAAHPDLARIHFQLCQCLIKDGRHHEASEQCGVAARMAGAQGDQKSANQYQATQTALLMTDASSATSSTESGNGGGAATSPLAPDSGQTTTAAGQTISNEGEGLNEPEHRMLEHQRGSGAGANGRTTIGGKNIRTTIGISSTFKVNSSRLSSTQSKVTTPVVRPRVNTSTVTANVSSVNTPTTRVPTTRVPTIRIPTVPTVRIH